MPWNRRFSDYIVNYSGAILNPLNVFTLDGVLSNGYMSSEAALITSTRSPEKQKETERTKCLDRQIFTFHISLRFAITTNIVGLCSTKNSTMK